jgi:hypothetical protein
MPCAMPSSSPVSFSMAVTPPISREIRVRARSYIPRALRRHRQDRVEELDDNRGQDAAARDERLDGRRARGPRGPRLHCRDHPVTLALPEAKETRQTRPVSQVRPQVSDAPKRTGLHQYLRLRAPQVSQRFGAAQHVQQRPRALLPRRISPMLSHDRAANRWWRTGGF